VSSNWKPAASSLSLASRSSAARRRNRSILPQCEAEVFEAKPLGVWRGRPVSRTVTFQQLNSSLAAQRARRQLMAANFKQRLVGIATAIAYALPDASARRSWR
jgi:hypothetical protein